ncbi:hypothetical protein ACTQ5K_23860 [Niallia sp. Sow4_A1]|uniref:hypothetical protein n=1 Tax=Niallia sp. Sow4_A1 TaxID=3438793 RepID=UPI003F9E4F97
MAKNRKKVVLLIVEGESDETLLIDRLRELFRDHEIRFEPQRGDILYDAKKQMKPIKEVIGDTVKEILIKRKFKSSDILAVIHIMDTDGCLIPKENVVIDNQQETLTYYKNTNISVQSETQMNNILNRNEIRGRNIRTMNSIDTIVSNKYAYQMFYFSRNLEHVIFNEPNPCSGTKVDNIEEFLEELDSPLEAYLSQYMPHMETGSYREQYIASWTFISEGIKSLQRSTNVPLMFKFIELKSSEL